MNWESSSLLEKLLESLERYPASGETEVIVVDNASSDFDQDELSARFPEVRFLPQSENLGFAAGNNLAAREASGEYLVLLNPDTEVTQGALDALLVFLDAHPKAAVAAPRLVYPDGRVQRSCRGFPWPGSLLFYAFRLNKLLPRSRVAGAYMMDWFGHDGTMQVDQPMASCWAVRSKVWRDVGEFDLQFPLFYNDVDWALRASLAGYENWFVNEAVVVHHHGQSTRKAGAAAHRETHYGLARFYRKWAYGRRPRLAIWLALGASYIFYRLRRARSN